MSGVLDGHCRFVATPGDAELAAAEGAIARADARVDRALLRQAPALRVIARTGVGTDLIDVPAATARGIAVVITPGAGAAAVAEGAIGMALHLVKRFGPLTALVREGRWAERAGVSVGDLDGATLGVVGYGRIGRRTAALAAAFGMRVLAYDPVSEPPACRAWHCASLGDLAARSDVITLHLPLNEQTRHLVDDAFLARVRPGAVLVNCGRGGLIDTDAVWRALTDGRLSGVGLDVFDPEPPGRHPLYGHPDVVLTPHLMGLSRRATAATFTAAARGVLDVLCGREPQAVADPAWRTHSHEGDPLMTSSRTDKIAGAPISWGVCEVPGWGYQLSPGRVLTEMQQVGLAATEFGPDGFLPADPAVMAEFLASRHLTAVGGFTPVVLHEAGHDPAPEIERLLDGYDAARAEVLVLSAATGRDGYDTRPDLDEAGWKTLLANLDRLTGLAAARGVRAVLHPHVGTMVERGDEVRRVLEGSAISLCLDTGHLLIGGTDPAELTRQAPDRIAHTHFKDVDDQIAAQVRSGRLSYTEGVRRGMYRPLGRGDVDFAAIVSHLRGRDYGGWYVLEQDTILTEEPRGEGPVADVRQSADYLRGC